MSSRSKRLAARRAHWPATGSRLVLAACASLLMAACGSSGDASPPRSPKASVTSTESPTVEHYQLLMRFYAAESGTTAVIDPMTFTAAPGTAAAVGPLSVRHVAGVAPAKQAGPPTSPLLGADGISLKITRGQWKKAQGTVAFSCVGSKGRATSTLKGLIPSGTYSAFVVHANLDGPGRFTPWGDAAGTTNNFTASATGTATPTNTRDGCFTNADDIIIIWHSDSATHGRSPGKIGVNWHTSLIARVP
jgi:hypothetical protein